MRIGFDANPIRGDRGGIGWLTHYLFLALLELKEDIEFVGYLDPGLLRDGALEGWGPSPTLRWVEAGLWGMRLRGRVDRLDLYHGTNLWAFPRADCGDSLRGFGGFPSPQGRSRYNRTEPASRAADRPVHPVRGGADPRKNHETLLRAYARYADRLKAHSLVMVGNPVHRFWSILLNARALGLRDRVICAGRVSSADLRLLYSHADLFVFPSIYEGFGMPVLEAMACGAPVITSNTTSLPEVAGDAAVLVDPGSSGELGEALVRVVEDPKLREEMRAKGFERVKQFTWEKAARRMVALYRELCR